MKTADNIILDKLHQVYWEARYTKGLTHFQLHTLVDFWDVFLNTEWILKEMWNKSSTEN